MPYKVGNRVRVKTLDITIKAELANKIGTVGAVILDGDACRVYFSKEEYRDIHIDYLILLKFYWYYAI